MAAHATRLGHLAAIHIAHKALGLSADDASALKLAVTGVASAGAMSEQQRRRYLAHLAGLQKGTSAAQSPRRAPRPPALRSADDAQDERWLKARALWAALAASGQVRIDTDAALMAYVKRQTHIEHWRFLNGYQVNSVIESLKRWCARAGVGKA